MEEWDEHMSDFVPDDMLTVELQAREEIVSIEPSDLYSNINCLSSHYTRMPQKTPFTSEVHISSMLHQEPRKAIG